MGFCDLSKCLGNLNITTSLWENLRKEEKKEM
jgi:hypothetical protein